MDYKPRIQFVFDAHPSGAAPESSPSGWSWVKTEDRCAKPQMEMSSLVLTIQWNWGTYIILTLKPIFPELTLTM